MTGFGVRVERLHCPLCAWTHERESPPQTTHTFPAGQSPLHDGAPATLQEALADAAYATLLADALETEGVVRAHLETHDLIEWVAEVMRLRAAKDDRQRGPSGAASAVNYRDVYVPVLCSACGSLVGSVHPLVKPGAWRCGVCARTRRHD